MDMNALAAADNYSSGNTSNVTGKTDTQNSNINCNVQNGTVIWSANKNSAKTNNSLMVNDFVATQAETDLTLAPCVLNESTEFSKNNSPSREFDLNLPTRYFKSSFARSLSLSSSNYTRSLDFEVNAQKQSKAATTDAATKSNVSMSKNMMDLPSKPPPIPARRPLSAVNGSIYHIPHLQQHHHQQQQQQLQQKQIKSKFANADNSSEEVVHVGNKTTNQHNYQRQQQQVQHSHSSCNFSEIANKPQSCVAMQQSTVAPAEAVVAAAQFTKPSIAAATTAFLPKPAMMLTEHTRDRDKDSFEMHNTGIGINVEAVVLQNQVDTLQWQMKQMEASCDMYRAVLEEVARFLERFQTLKDYTQQRKNMDQITRSKSLYHVFDAAAQQDKMLNNNQLSTNAHSRARSSTNLIDFKPLSKKSIKQQDDNIESCNDTMTSSYEAFKDFTWRRSPRKKDTKINIEDNLEEKLQQEAFRMSRTIHNLLNTQQPDLTQHRSTRLGSANAVSMLIPNVPLHNNTAASGNGNVSSKCVGNATLANETHFLRTQNMRDSRLSLRSSTDSSAHSTISSAASSSSKTETDEEHSPFCTTNALSNHKLFQNQPTKQNHLICSTEDESGFSSISSFQDVGLPLSSSLLSHSTSYNCEDVALANTSEQFYSLDANMSHNRNSTLKPSTSTPARPSSMIGVPLRSGNQSMQSPWDISNAKTNYRNTNQFQRFSTLSNEDSTTVLWV